MEAANPTCAKPRGKAKDAKLHSRKAKSRPPTTHSIVI